MLLTAAFSCLFVLSVLVACTAALTHAAGPKSGAAGAAGFLILLFAVTAIFTETVGRVAFTRPAFLVAAAGLLAAGLLVSFFVIRRTGHIPRRARLSLPLRRVPALAWPFIIVWAGLFIYGCAAQIIPPADIGDALRYHFAAPANWAALDRIGPVPDADYRINHFPHMMGLLWGLPLALTGSDLVSGFFPLLAAFALWPAIICFIARSLRAELLPSLTLAIVSASAPLIMLQGMNHGVDVLFWSASLMALFLALRQDTFRRNWIMFAAAAGIALGTKSFGLVAIAIAALVWFIRRIQPLFNESLASISAPEARRAAIETAGAAALILLIGGWVYLGNLGSYGNPVYPYDFPITFGAAQPDELFFDKGVLSSTATHRESFWAIFSLTPNLLLSLPPLDRDFTSNTSGLGVTAPVLTLLFSVLAIVWHVRNRKTLRAAGRPLAFFYGFALLVLAVNAVLIAQWGFQVAQEGIDNYSSVGRYQIFWLGLLAVGVALYLKRQPRLILPALAILGLCLAYNAQTVSRAQTTSFADLTRHWNLFPDRLAQTLRNEGAPRVVTNNLERFPDSSILLVNSREHTYGYFFPAFQRRVLITPINTPTKNILRGKAGNRALYDAYIQDRSVPERCLSIIETVNSNATKNQRRAINYALIDKIIFENDVLFVLEYRGIPYLHRDPRFDLIIDFSERHRPFVFYQVREDAKSVWRDFEDCLTQIAASPG